MAKQEAIKANHFPKRFIEKIAILFFFLFSFEVFSQAPPAYLVIFNDKPNYQQYKPSDILSPRAIENRRRYNIPITKEDYPVDTSYIAAVLKQDTAIGLLTQSKWMNYIVISCDSSCLNAIRQLSFVKSASALHRVNYQNLISGKAFREIIPEKREKIPSLTTFSVDTAYYGLMYPQIKLHNGHFLHHIGYKGNGMLIALLDAGYGGLDFPIFENLHQENRLIGRYDFVREDHDIFFNSTHGMSVLSLMAGKIPYTAVGTAPEAQYVIMKTEANSYEEILEEYFLVAGLECADSLGTDVVNISLGYSEFDSKNTSHTFADSDGLHSVASIAVAMAIEKGMIVSNSAGNEGDKNWKYISIPADAYNVLSVAAINTEGQLASFSSRGSALFNRIKPNLASVGLDTYVQKSNGNIEKGNGTSFSSPVNAGLVACLRQAFPQKTSHEIIRAIFQSCNHVQNPDTLTGYGVPDYWLAFKLLDASAENKNDIVHIYPNPVQSMLQIKTFYPYRIVKLEIIDVWGQILYSLSYGGNDFVEMDFSFPASGIYMLRVHTTGGIAVKKVIKI